MSAVGTRREQTGAFVRERVVPPLIGFVVFHILWELLAAVFGNLNFVLPGPIAVYTRLIGAWADGTMWPHVAATLTTVLLGFVAGAVAGLLLGYLLARSRIANRVLSPYIVAAQAVPILALAPLMAIWFGTGLLSHTIIVALTAFFPMAVSAMVAIKSVDRRLLEMGKSFRVTRRQRLTMIELPAAIPGILGGIRIGVTLSVVGAIVADWAQSGDKGLGVLINLARGMFDIPLMYATLLTIALIGIALYGIVLLVERRFAFPTG